MPLNLGALLGGNQGQGGLVNPLLALQKQQQQKQVEAATLQGLRAYAAQQQQGQPPAGMPPQGGTPPAPMGGAQPSGQSGGMTAQAGPQRPQQPMPPSPPPQLGGLPQQGAQPSPRSDMMAMIEQVSSMPGLNDTQRYQVLQNMGAFTAPMEKYTQQMELASQKLSMQQQMLDERLAESKRWHDLEHQGNIPQQEKADKPTAEDKDQIKALDDDVSMWKTLVTTGPEKDHDKNIAGYNAARKARAEYTKNKKSSGAAAPAGGGASPDPAALSDTEERSLDGGKTWWYLQNGKPVQSGG